MFENRFTLRKIVLLLGDLALLFFSLYFALKIRYFFSGEHFYAFSRHFEYFLITFILWLVVFYLFDLYNLRKIRGLAFLFSSLILALGVNLILAMIFFYWFFPEITPKTLLILVAVIGGLMVFLWRVLWSRVLSKNFRPRVAIIGSDETKIKVLNEVLSPSEMHYDVIGFISLGQETSLLTSNFSVIGNYEDLMEIIKREKIDELVVAFNYYKYPEATKKITECLNSNLKITEMSLFYEEAVGKVPTDCIDQIWFLVQLKNQRRVFNFLERFCDIIISSLGLIVALPFVPLIALLVKINSRGPVFYSQWRLGKNEKPYKLYKFRSMVDHAEQQTGAVWAKDHDPRVTKVGAFLRKVRLDEIPQLWSVLTGQMSLVGPRPERPEFVTQLKNLIPFYSHRHLVKPGLTGWAQVKHGYAKNAEDTMHKLQYDLYYVKNRSLLLYLIILVRTIRIVITHKGI